MRFRGQALVALASPVVLAALALALWAPPWARSAAWVEALVAVPVSEPSLRLPVALALGAGLWAWAMARAVWSTATRGALAPITVGVGVACALVLATPALWQLDVEGALGALVVLHALASWRKVALASSTEIPVHVALASALLLLLACALSPAYGALAAPASVVWWRRVAAHRGRIAGRRERRLAMLWVPPLALAGASALFVRALVAGSAWELAERLTAARASLHLAMERLGPTATAAALAALAALVGSQRSECAAADRLTAALGGALLVGGALLPGGDPGPSAPLALALALGAGIAILRLGELLSAEPSAARAASLTRALAFGAGALAVAAGLVVTLPSLLLR